MPHYSRSFYLVACGWSLVSKALGSRRHREKSEHNICLLSRPSNPPGLAQDRSDVFTTLCKDLHVLLPAPSPVSPSDLTPSHDVRLPLLQPRWPPGSSHSTCLTQDLCMCYFPQSYAWLSPSPPSSFHSMFYCLFLRSFEKQYSLSLRMLLTKIIMFCQ